MANEDFTTYTEVDPNGHLSVIPSKITATGLHRNEVAYIYNDKGVAFFDGDFEHLLEAQIEASSANFALMNVWAMSNALGDEQGLIDASESLFGLTVAEVSGNAWVILFEVDSGTRYFDNYINGTLGQLYYHKIVRDESVGFGQLQCFIFSDFGRTILIDTLSITLHTSKKDFRYIFGAMSKDDDTGNTLTFNGFSQDLDLQIAAISGKRRRFEAIRRRYA